MDSAVNDSSSEKHRNQPVTNPSPLSLFSNLSGMAYAAILLIIYVMGFVTLNAYLLKFGINETEYTNPRVMIAAFSLILFLFCFYIFAGRAAFFMSKWLKFSLDLIKGDRYLKLWSILFLIFSLVHTFFVCCLSAAFFFAISIPHVHSLFFSSILLGFFFATYGISYFNLDVRFPKAANTIKTIIESIAIYAFFFVDKNASLFLIFTIYVGIFFIITIILDRYDRERATYRGVIFDISFSFLFLLMVAAIYGNVIYGSVSSKVGGGAPTKITFMPASRLDDLFSNKQEIGHLAWKGELIYQTQAFSFIKANNIIVKLPNDSIIIYMDELKKKNE